MRRTTKVFLPLGVFLFPCPCWAQTFFVPEDYPTIQRAIDAAGDGWEIVVSPGRYVENINFRGKDIILRSVDPTSPPVVASTIIDGSHNDSVVIFAGAEPATCKLLGFTITNGHWHVGGGIRDYGTQAVIRYNIITGNSADYAGGGLFGCAGTIQNNIITGNRADYLGGGLAECTARIENNTITDNRAGEYGGGLYLCSGNISHNTIANNRARHHGGGLYWCHGVIRNNIISGNSGDLTGGGLWLCGGTIQGNTISSNSAGSAAGGLGFCNGTIVNNIISDNWAEDCGGGLWACNGEIHNNTITGNSASYAGGGLSSCKAWIRNCIVWGNSACYGAQIYGGCFPSYCCIQDWIEGGEGNISDDPKLVNPAAGDFHLRPDSPCIDAGCDIEGLEEDFEGNPRPFGAGFDIGADEFIPAAAVRPDIWVLY